MSGVVANYSCKNNFLVSEQKLNELVYVTKSTKTQHNGASLNLQYKPLVTIDKKIAYFISF